MVNRGEGIVGELELTKSNVSAGATLLLASNNLQLLSVLTVFVICKDGCQEHVEFITHTLRVIFKTCEHVMYCNELLSCVHICVCAMSVHVH